MPVVICTHCGSSLTAPDTQTAPLRCPVCGANLSAAPAADMTAPPVVQEAVVRDQEDDSATRAVAREQLAPLLTPVDADYHTEPSAASATLGNGAAPGVRWDGATQVSAPHIGADAHDITQALPDSALPNPPRTPASALRTLSVALVTLVLLAVVAIAALAVNGAFSGLTGYATNGTPTQQATAAPPTPTATPAFTPFTVANLYTIGHPFGWNASQRNAAPQTYAALFSAPDGSASMNVDVQQNVNLADPAALDQQFIRALTAPNTPLTLSDPTTSVIGGQRWTERAADITLVTASGQPLLYAHVVARTVVHGAYAYTIVEVAPATSATTAATAYATANVAYFQPMLATFTFLG